VVERGQIVKVSMDKDGVITREQPTRHWTDWINYRSMDFDFENKHERLFMDSRLIEGDGGP